MSGDPAPAVITGVVGGSHGMAVATEHALALAADYDTAGDRLRDWGRQTASVLVDGDLLASAVLSPVTFAEAEAAVLAAASGPDGLLVASLVWEADALTVRVAVRATQLTDASVAASIDRLDHDLGRTLGFGLGAVAPALAVTAAAGYLAWSRLPPGPRADLQDDSLARLGVWVDRHPEAVQHLANGGGGLLEGLWDGLTPLHPGGPFGVPLVAPDTESAARLLAGLYRDGHAHTAPTDLTVPGSTTPPADLAGLVRHLAAVDDLSGPGHHEHDGTVEIQTITASDGSVRHIVYLPGTDDLGTTPWSQDGDVRDLGTNLLLVSGQDNAYQEGILDAMRQAGIRPGEPVALVGHSQGGMEAAAILSQGSPFTVTHVVTAGSPTAYLPGFPPGSHVLSLENHGDVVPLLDGADNPDSAEQVTVRFDDHRAGVVVDHDLHPYVEGAVAVQASDDPSLREQLASLADAGFVGPADGKDVTSQVFQITRVP